MFGAYFFRSYMFRAYYFTGSGGPATSSATVADWLIHARRIGRR